MKNSKKQKPTQAEVLRFINTKLKSSTKRLRAHIEKEYKANISILQKLEQHALKLRKNDKDTDKPKKRKYTRRRKTGETITHKKAKTTHRKLTKAASVKSAKIVALKHEKEKKAVKYQAANKLFLEVLKEIGRPCMTNEVALRARKLHPEESKHIARDNKTLYRLLYNSAFNLSKSGELKRHPIGGKAYEYSLKDWKNGNGHNGNGHGHSSSQANTA